MENGRLISERIEREYGEQIVDLEIELKARAARHLGKRTPATASEVIAKLRATTDDESAVRYVTEEASIEAAKRILLGYYSLKVSLERSEPKAMALVASLLTAPGQPLGMRGLLIAAAECWTK